MQRFGIVIGKEFISNSHTFPGCKPIEYQSLPDDFNPRYQSAVYLFPVDYGAYLFVPLAIKEIDYSKDELTLSDEEIPF